MFNVNRKQTRFEAWTIEKERMDDGKHFRPHGRTTKIQKPNLTNSSLKQLNNYFSKIKRSAISRGGESKVSSLVFYIVTPIKVSYV